MSKTLDEFCLSAKLLEIWITIFKYGRDMPITIGGGFREIKIAHFLRLICLFRSLGPKLSFNFRPNPARLTTSLYPQLCHKRTHEIQQSY